MCEDPFRNPSKKFLHCFVLNIGKDGKEYVIDGTINAVIEKQQYMDIYKADMITELSQPEFCEYIDFMSENGYLCSEISIVEYLCFPNEITEGVKKYIKTK